ncbi:MAG: MerR family transcriptional regulator [Candidatus Velamenicoccus archaeovorus]
MEAANLFKVHERTVRFWIRKGWVKVKRDYRNFPVFTAQDIRKIKKWRSTLKG